MLITLRRGDAFGGTEVKYLLRYFTHGFRFQVFSVRSLLHYRTHLPRSLERGVLSYLTLL
jgi:hypothetical protein